MHTRKRKEEFHEGMIFSGGAGLKKTNKGLDVLWNWNRAAEGVTAPVPEGSRGRSWGELSLRGSDLESHQLWLWETASKQKLWPLRRNTATANTGPGREGAQEQIPHVVLLCSSLAGCRGGGGASPADAGHTRQSLRAKAG